MKLPPPKLPQKVYTNRAAFLLAKYEENPESDDIDREDHVV